MPGYYLYFLDAEGHIRRRLDLECEHDADAIAQAEGLSDGAEMELWQNSRRVRVFPRRQREPRDGGDGG